MSTTIRVDDEAPDALEQRRFFDRFNERYAELADDSDAWAEVLEERTLESGALGGPDHDGIETPAW